MNDHDESEALYDLYDAVATEALLEPHPAEMEEAIETIQEEKSAAGSDNDDDDGDDDEQNSHDHGAAVNENDNNAASEEEDDDDGDDFLAIINTTLAESLSKAQEEAHAAAEALAAKRRELEALEAEAEAKADQIDTLREQARAVADDEQWMGMYERLKAWSKEKGHCNPRRNWQSKIDAEEKALGNWSGKQRRDERQSKLNPFKKAALEKLGFAFEPKALGWKACQTKLKEYVAQHGKIPENLNDPKIKEAGLWRQVHYYRQQPLYLLGECKDFRKKDADGNSVKAVMENNHFTQERIDVLTEAGMVWKLNSQQIRRLKDERGLVFKHEFAGDQIRPPDGDVVALERHTWLTLFEALVEFKKKHGHTYVTQHNASEELHFWVKEQRKRMMALQSRKEGKGPGKGRVQQLSGYQADMLGAIGFVYYKPDIEWMENYERLAAFKRLFGVVAVTDKWSCFEMLQQWLDYEKRSHLSLPQMSKGIGATLSGVPSISMETRKKLLDDLGVFEVPVGEEEAAARKSNYYFRNADQVRAWDMSVLKSYREKKKKALGISEEQTGEGEGAPSLAEKCMESTGDIINPEKERSLFERQGAIVAATITEREERMSGSLGYYSDGRPCSMCRVSTCYMKHYGLKQYFLCNRHYKVLDDAVRCDPSFLLANQPADSGEASASDEIEAGEDGRSSSSASYSCENCEKIYRTYDALAAHAKGCGSVLEATPIPGITTSEPSWSKALFPDDLRGEAKVLAEHYRCLVWKTALKYKRISEEHSKTNNKYVDAVLHKQLHNLPESSNSDFQMAIVKFPSSADEIESIKLFRCCGGPLAATVAGHEKIWLERGRYGDGRALDLCRVSGCTTKHESAGKRYLCNWHHSMIERVSLGKEPDEENAGKRKPDQTPAVEIATKLSEAATMMKNSISNPQDRSASPELRNALPPMPKKAKHYGRDITADNDPPKDNSPTTTASDTAPTPPAPKATASRERGPIERAIMNAGSLEQAIAANPGIFTSARKSSKSASKPSVQERKKSTPKTIPKKSTPRKMPNAMVAGRGYPGWVAGRGYPGWVAGRGYPVRVPFDVRAIPMPGRHGAPAAGAAIGPYSAQLGRGGKPQAGGSSAPWHTDRS